MDTQRPKNINCSAVRKGDGEEKHCRPVLMLKCILVAVFIISHSNISGRFLLAKLDSNGDLKVAEVS